MKAKFYLKRGLQQIMKLVMCLRAVAIKTKHACS